MARSEGFEPPTPRFVVWCSIQLSYERAQAGRPAPATRRTLSKSPQGRKGAAGVPQGCRRGGGGSAAGDQLRSSFAKSSQKKPPRIGSVTPRMIVDSEKMIGTCDWCDAVMVQL